MKEREGLEKQ